MLVAEADQVVPMVGVKAQKMVVHMVVVAAPMTHLIALADLEVMAQ
jgi:hypothetical protein